MNTRQTRSEGHRRRCGRTVLFAGILAFLSTFAGAGAAHAQAYASGQLQGTVTDGFQDPVSGALVTLWAGGDWTGAEVTTGRDGTFVVDPVTPGTYELRVEALGFHPVVVRGLQITPSGAARVSVELREGTPPITVVDTVFSAAGGPLAERWLLELERGLPTDSRELRESLELVTTLDRSGGALGLPSGYTLYRVQGVPFRAAATAPGHQDENAVLSLGSAGLVRTGIAGPSAGMGLGAGGEVEVFNPVLGHRETELFAAYSPTDLWAGRYDTPEGFTPSSFWGSGRTSIVLRGDSLRLTVGGDFQHMERPRLALLPGGSAFSGPGLEDAQIAAAYALMDWTLRGGNRLDFGARVGSRPQAASVFRPAWPGTVSPLQARDAVVGGGGFFEIGESLNLQARLGFTRSERSWSDDAAVAEGTPGVVDLASGRRAGLNPAAAGPSSRTGAYFALSAGIQSGGHDAALGFDFLRSAHEIDPAAGVSYLSGAADPFSAGWSGLVDAWTGGPGAVEFAVPTLAVFFRDDWAVTPGTTLRFGARWIRQSLPGEDFGQPDAWTAVSGLALDETDASVSGLSAHLGFDWAPGGGSTSITGSAGITADEVDPWILAEVIAGDGSLQRTRLAGSSLPAWPAIPDAAAATFSAPSQTFLGASVALPASTWGQLAVATRVSGLKLSLSGSFRRTENLFRRNDLNRTGAPTGVSESGRSTWGTPAIAGGLVYAEPGSSRRFSEFDHVWFMLQDGWSEQANVTAGAEGEFPGGITLGAWYTWSRTTDNMPGLGTGQRFVAGTVDVPVDDWEEGTSDLDIPHRIGAALGIHLPILAGGTLRTRLQLQSGRPFTPGLRPGVDLNADGVAGNDPVVVPDGGIDGLTDRWSCLDDSRGDFVERNSCRLPWEPYLNVGLSLGLLRLGESVLSLQVDAMNLLQAFDTTIDPALLLVNPAAGLQADGTTVTPDFLVNGRLGGELFDTRQGRMLRIGIRLGGTP